MIKSLDIENFQSHAKTRLEFVEGVNWIVGASDTGKSAIARAMCWLFENRPSGDAFRSHWGGDTIVQIELENKDLPNCFIRRVKEKNDNFYTHQPDDETVGGMTFRAFGQNVPDEITDALYLDPSINFQRQHDGPFLVNDSPGEVARELNRVASLDEIDTTFAAIESRLRSVTRKHKELEAETIDRQVRLEALTVDVDQREAAIIPLEANQEKVRDKRRTHDGLSATVAECETAQHKVHNAARYDGAADAVERLAQLDGEILNEVTGYHRLVDEIEEAETAQTAIDSCSAIATVDVSGLETLAEQIVEKRIKIERLMNAVDNIDDLIGCVEDTEQRLAKTEDELAANTPDECPLCGRGE